MAAAFANLPAIVSHNVSAAMQYGGSANPPSEHVIHVDGQWYTAHETGHQIARKVPLPDMECGPGSDPVKLCENGVNSVYESAVDEEWTFLGNFTPAIHWEPTDLGILQNYFNCTAQSCP